MHFLRLYKRKKKKLSPQIRSKIKETLTDLQKNLLERNREGASEKALQSENLGKLHLKKNAFDHVRDSFLALVIALVIAVGIRSMWFELFEIPTGSMRPTFEEQDRLVVSKTAFGLNVPFLPRHFYFDPDLVKRSGTLIFTGANMNIPNGDTLYFYLFPGKKQYVKRLMGKPGDTLYFYGGLIYGIDREGNDISSKLQLPFLNRIDHVPYIRLEGRVELPSSPSTNGIYSPVILKQMNQKVAELKLTKRNRIEGNLLSPYAEKMDDYYDLWGFSNYGMSRLVTQEEVPIDLVKREEQAPFYMEIFHHPSVKSGKIKKGIRGKLYPSVGVSSTLLPLKEKHLKALFANLYTARFIAKGGRLFRFGSLIKPGDRCFLCPQFPSIPDGTYEFYYGKGYKILWGGIRKELPQDHPLLKYSPKLLQLLYNLGIEFNTLFSPQTKHQSLLPSRYVYYREGDLYTMGAPFMKKGDPTLIRFEQNERLKKESAFQNRPYPPFLDQGPPETATGKIDKNFIRCFGITIPDKHYLVLGDNYAMSSDSRDFGFVPEDNIRGVPALILWPPGNRMGTIPQPHYALLTFPRLLIWSLLLVIILTWRYFHHKRWQRPID